MSKTYKGDVTGNVVELNLLDANEGTLPNLGTPTVVTRNTGPNDVTQVVGDITSSSGFSFDFSAKGLVIGTSCTSIGSYAFQFCQGLTGSLIIPDSVIIIGNNAFDSCDGLTGSLTIPNSVTTIIGGAFFFCSGFNGSLTIGNSVTAIGGNAFNNCSAITSVSILATIAPTIDSNAFFNMTSVSPAEIHVPAGATGYAASYDGLTVVYDL